MRLVIAVVLGAILLLVGFKIWTHKTPVHGGSIVFLGDSITAGYGLDPGQGYPDLIRIPGMTTQNFGVAGNTSADGLQRLRDFFADGATPRLVVIALGANDILHGVPADATEANLNDILAECKKRSIPVLLCGVKIPYKFGTDAIFENVAHKNHVALVPDILTGAAFHDDLMQDDHMHPTAAGQKIIAEKMRAALLDHFAFETN
jgi:acyl-CoA thioesterase-1